MDLKWIQASKHEKWIMKKRRLPWEWSIFSISLRTKSVSNSRGELNLVYLFQTRTSSGVTTVLSWSRIFKLCIMWQLCHRLRVTGNDYYRVNEQETLLTPDVFHFNQLSCLKLFCQVHLICAAINMGKTEKKKLYTVTN